MRVRTFLLRLLPGENHETEFLRLDAEVNKALGQGAIIHSVSDAIYSEPSRLDKALLVARVVVYTPPGKDPT